MDDEIPRMPLVGQIRAAMCTFVADAGRQRALPTLLHVGDPLAEPGDTHVVLQRTRYLDASLRADLVTSAIDRLEPTVEPPVTWLTRTGTLVVGDEDVAWFAAALTAYERHGLGRPAFFVITRKGWRNVPTDEVQTWGRVRPRRPAS